MQKTLHNKIALGNRFTISDEVKEAAWNGIAVIAIFLLAALLAAATL